MSTSPAATAHAQAAIDSLFAKVHASAVEIEDSIGLLALSLTAPGHLHLVTWIEVDDDMRFVHKPEFDLNLFTFEVSWNARPVACRWLRNPRWRSTDG